MLKWLRRIGGLLAVLIIGLALATWLTARRGDESLYPPKAGQRTVTIYLVDHGYHAGIVLPRAAVAEFASGRGYPALVNVSERFAAYPWLELGWGDEGFYRHVPTVGSLSVGLALRAFFMPGNPSVLHVVGVQPDPAQVFGASALIPIELSLNGFDRLLGRLEATFAAKQPGLIEDLGPGLYGPSRFFRAVGTFHLFRVCNHWVADLLNAAGLPTSPILATAPPGLLLYLRWRVGLIPLRRS
jgi:uncharacterized protein (TIGR02117 family)